MQEQPLFIYVEEAGKETVDPLVGKELNRIAASTGEVLGNAIGRAIAWMLKAMIILWLILSISRS